jgi:hypothetical protein
MLCGYRSYSAIAEWGRNYGARIAHALGFTHNTPCAATLHTVFRHVDRDAVEATLGAWAEGVVVSTPAAPSAGAAAVALDGKTLRGWVHAYRLNAEQAGRARHTCRQRHKKGTPKVETLYLAGWVLVFTTLPPAVLSAQTIMALYRCRWQVELAIKRWKSVLDVDALRAKVHSPLAEVWLHGKLLYALMLERRMRRQLGDRWGRLDHERLSTWWRVWGMLKDEMAPMITGALFWREDAWAACLKVLAERPRRRKLQQLPPEAIDLLYCCDASKQEGMPMAA